MLALRFAVPEKPPVIVPPTRLSIADMLIEQSPWSIAVHVADAMPFVTV